MISIICDYRAREFTEKKESTNTRFKNARINLADLDPLDLIPWRQHRKKRDTGGCVGETCFACPSLGLVNIPSSKSFPPSPFLARLEQRRAKGPSRP